MAMDNVLCKRKGTDGAPKRSSIKDFLKAVSPRKKRKLRHEPEKQKQTPAPIPMPLPVNTTPNTFITSSPKPKLSSRTPQKSFRATLSKENDENYQQKAVPFSPRTPKSVSEPVSRKLSFDDIPTPTGSSNEQADPSEILFSPIFNKKTALKRSYTSLGCISPNINHESQIVETKRCEEEQKLKPAPASVYFSLRSDESLDDLSDSDSGETCELVDYTLNTDTADDILGDFSVEEIEIQTESDIEFEHDLDSLYFIKNVPSIPESYQNRSPHLPPKRADAPKITLVLDLDETLVHCETSPLANPDYQFPVEFHGHLYQVYGRKRPFVDKFLSKVAQLFEIVVFTASQQVYAEYILDELDNNGVIDHKMFRDSCVHVNGNYLKDLSVLGRDLDKVIIVDNSITAFSYQVENGIPIISWYDDTKDRELLDLIPFLEQLADVEDVRPHLQSAFNIQAQIDALP